MNLSEQGGGNNLEIELEGYCAGLAGASSTATSEAG